MDNSKELNLDLLTCHGLPNYFRAENKFLKLIWMVLFLAFFSISSLTCIQSIISFLNYDVVNKFQYVKNSDIPLFPVVSLCSLNPFVTENSIKLVEKILFDSNVNDIVESKKLDELAGDYLNEHFTFTRFLLQSQLYNSSSQIRKNMVSTLDEILLNCKYDFEACSVKDFEWFYMFDYGNCYKFKSNLKSNRKGQSNGLKLELFLKQTDSVNSLMFSNGIHIFINNQTTEPLRGEGIDVSAGYETYLALRKKSYFKLAKPYSNCVMSNINNKYQSNLQLITLSNYGKYTRRSCFDMCYQNFIIENCQCYSILFPNINEKYRPCGLNFEKNACNLRKHIEFYRNISHNLCPSLCPVECETSDFEIRMFFSSYPSRPYLNVLNKNSINKTNRKEYLSLNVFYDIKDEIIVKEIPKYSIFDLIGSLGGSIGLYTGMSMLSIFEFIEITIILIKKIFTK